jgi:GT2 family glycosyltransferase
MFIAMPVWDTVENRRSELTKAVIPQVLSLMRPTDRLVVSDNGSCKATKSFYTTIDDPRFSVIYNERNLGIAGGTNVAWRQAPEGEILCKMDNDCFIHQPFGELVEWVFYQEPTIGILGLKRKDLAERPDAQEPHYRSKLFYVAHAPGERWVVVEKAQHIMGTCYCFNPVMLPKFGYLNQPKTVYGFDDALAAARAQALGYKTCFLPQIEIDHLDPPNVKSDPYTHWKHIQAGEGIHEYNRLVDGYTRGTISPYYGGEDAA